MWPWGHLAVGYLVYSLLSRTDWQGPLRASPVLALVVGTQFPDLVDKPLAWTFGLLPNGRSLTHSLLTAVLLIALLRTLSKRRDRVPLVFAFSIGYLSHLGSDALYPIVTSEYASLRFLAWPLVPAIEYSTDQSFIAHFQSIEITSFFAFELGLVLVAIVLWLYDGAPGLTVVRQAPYRVYQQIAADQ